MLVFISGKLSVFSFLHISGFLSGRNPDTASAIRIFFPAFECNLFLPAGKINIIKSSKISLHHQLEYSFEQIDAGIIRDQGHGDDPIIHFNRELFQIALTVYPETGEFLRDVSLESQNRLFNLRAETADENAKAVLPVGPREDPQVFRIGNSAAAFRIMGDLRECFHSVIKRQDAGQIKRRKGSLSADRIEISHVQRGVLPGGKCRGIMRRCRNRAWPMLVIGMGNPPLMHVMPFGVVKFRVREAQTVQHGAGFGGFVDQVERFVRTGIAVPAEEIQRQLFLPA